MNPKKKNHCLTQGRELLGGRRTKYKKWRIWTQHTRSFDET